MAVRDPVCRKCGILMQSVAEIAPMGTGPGLKAFMCEHCGSADSTLVYPQHGESRLKTHLTHAMLC
jgi:hypothetical protein